jgi:lipoate-protein ligase A
VCFDQPAAGELVVGGRKLVGSAVWRQGESYLQHGSILLHDDQQLLQTLTPSALPAPPAATLAECFVGLDDEAMGRRIRLAVHERLQACGELRVRGELQEATWPTVVASQHRHFSDPAWLWRR